MRLVLCFLVLTVFVMACKKQEAVETLGEYEIPFLPNAKRVYTYVRQPFYDTIVHSYHFSSSAERSYVQKIFANGNIQYERYYRYTGNHKQLIKEYYYKEQGSHYLSYTKLDGEIKDYQAIDLGKKYKGHKLKIWFTDEGGFRTVVTEQDQDVEETEVTWQGRSIPALKFQYSGSMKTMIKYFPVIKQGDEYEGEVWFAKEIGFTKSHTHFEDEDYIMQLISIDSTIFLPTSQRKE